MAMLRKSDPLYSLDIRSVNPRVKSLAVPSPLENMFNTIFVMSAHYFI